MKLNLLAILVSALFCFEANAAEHLRPIFDGTAKLGTAPEEVNAAHEAIALAPIAEPVLPEPQSKPKEEEAAPKSNENNWKYKHTREVAMQGAGLVGLVGGTIVGGTLGYIATSGSAWVVAGVIGGAAGGFLIGGGILVGLAYLFITLVCGMSLF